MRSGRGRRWPDCTVWPHRLLPPLRGERGRSGLPPGPLPCSQHATTTPRSSSPPPHERGVEDSGGHGNGGLGTGGSSRGDRPIPLQGATDVLGVRHNWGRRGSQEHYTWASRLMGCSPDDGRLSRTPPICPPAPSTRGGAVQQPEGDGPAACTPGGPGRVQDSWRTRRQSTKGTEECTSRGSEGLFGSGLTHSSRTYRAVADALEEAVMRKVRERLEMLNPHHVLALLSPIEQSEARELGEMVWSALFCEPGALDDAFCEDEMVDGCVVCLSRQKDAILLPCRHLVVCADRIEHCCPYCRGKADEALVVEYPEWPDA
ncbi:Zinc finger, C3HC4 type (RING finger) domain-containing protein [Giardia muris]|uniref:Zinc finger, C3HC4 type (RING finger) domain-containing protein n=2 Tax=Giardia muris TaxID=5742 RepID=A0A4Z1T9P6_GIAMU|nr:Zinc finger, C3HC4 type (RING finger) domain-containing protein [Giardia muris]|eukprot:TNJ29239.1 Zinc finger, C3HC4 type (RING finger) domain-containing protein [Giardia muris]